MGKNGNTSVRFLIALIGFFEIAIPVQLVAIPVNCIVILVKTGIQGVFD